MTKYLDIDKAKEQLNLQGKLNYEELTKQAPGIHEEEVERIARAWHDCTKVLDRILWATETEDKNIDTRNLEAAIIS